MDDAMIDSPAAANGESVPGKAPRIDGRRLRSERTRRLIVEAYMALVRENAQMPTAVQIADRAGYSVRSIFERFPDLTALRVAVTDYAIAEARAHAALRDLDAPRTTRIRSQVDQRAQTCERWLPLWRVLSTDASQSPDLLQRISVIRQLIVMRMEMMFKPELSAMPDSDRKKTVLALEAITAFESWARMRELYGLSVEEASTVWVRVIDRLLPATPA
jgi:AcrR family transcriptional regulator